MTVEILRLSELPVGEAVQAANMALDIRTGPADLSRLLVIDSTGLLLEHSLVFQLLVPGRRIESMLCLAVGPRAKNSRGLRLPGNLGGTQGSGVLWASDPDGIDWRVAASATAVGHRGGSFSGLDRLIELLAIEEVFDRVHELCTTKVPGRVASPGLRLAGADDESTVFAGALALAIRHLTEPGEGNDGPYAELLAVATEQATLDDNGSLARYRDEVGEAMSAATAALGKRGLFRRSDASAHEHVRAAGLALTDLRNLVVRLFRDANTLGELSDNQRRLLTASGIRLPAIPAADSAGEVGDTEAPISRAVAESIRGGDALPLVTRRLSLTEREVKRRGSASYLPEAERRCPSSLLDALSSPDPARSIGQARQDPRQDAAAQACAELIDLTLTVANREWSPAATNPDSLARARIALEGARKSLVEYASTVNASGSGMRGARLARIGETLTPALCDLVLRVLGTESATPSTSGQEAFENARKKTVDLLDEWAKHVQDEGISAQPPFAASSPRDAHIYSGADDVAEIRAALAQQPGQQMWQLCTPDDLSALDVSIPPQAVWFAPRLNRSVLAGAVATDQIVWTSSGSYAGLLRLVPLRPGLASSEWTTAPPVPAPSPTTEPS